MSELKLQAKCSQLSEGRAKVIILRAGGAVLNTKESYLTATYLHLQRSHLTYLYKISIYILLSILSVSAGVFTALEISEHERLILFKRISLSYFHE